MIQVDKFLIIRVGDTAPEFTATTLDGKTVTLSGYKGKVVLLDFWATWCAPCIAEMPNIKRAAERYGKGGEFVVLGISLDQDPETVKGFVRARGVPWVQIVLGPADRNPVAKCYNVTGIPATFLIGREGKVVAKDLRGRKLKRELKKLFPPRAVAGSENPSGGS